jgi:profilin
MNVANGITLHGFKFMAVRADSDEVIGRKGERGCFIIPTQQAILVAEVCISFFHSKKVG